MNRLPPFLEAAFGAEKAPGYDQAFAPLRALKDPLHLLLQVAFAHLPENAHVLVVGAGTGAEVRFMAAHFPHWTFTLVDPATAMLEVAKEKLAADGVLARCRFHAGFVDSLSEERHDAATSILVSHFLTDAEERQHYFQQIGQRLRPDAPLLNADLSAFRESNDFDSLMDLWVRMRALLLTPTPRADEVQEDPFPQMFGTRIAAHSPAEVTELMQQAGFVDVTHCYQGLLIAGWVANRAPAD